MLNLIDTAPESRARQTGWRIELQNVSKEYAGVHGTKKRVIDRISHVIEYGSNLGILGVNGAGKSTLMRLLAGIEVPTTGRIRRYGTVSWPLARNAGFVSQMTGEQNVRFVGRLYRMDLKELMEFVRDFSELGSALKEPVETYSSGMKARLQFAMSMGVPFNFYLVDEIVAVGDQRFQEKCRRVFAERRGNATVVMISHQISTLRQFCDKGALLQNGMLQSFDTLEAAILAYRDTQYDQMRRQRAL
jgi:capsular polysaccharide transport system ATP-binding protein